MWSKHGDMLCFVRVLLQVDALRLRLEEKESFLNKKTKQLQDLTEEKGTLAGEIRDMKDMLEVKERKINVLQKKVRSRDKGRPPAALWGCVVLFIAQTKLLQRAGGVCGVLG